MGTDLLSKAHHKMVALFSTVMGSISIVLSGAAGPVNEKQRNFLEIANRSAEKLAKLSDDAINLQRLKSAEFTFDMQENDINEVIQKVQETTAPLAEKKGLGLVLQPGNNLPKAAFDQKTITQVLTNILTNAVKFSAKGKITVTTGYQDEAIRVSVQDTGCGIKKQDLSKVFCEFEQLDKGSDRENKGAGLGLAIAEKIIAEHNGRIWAESEYGKGATFHFVLPVKQEA